MDVDRDCSWQMSSRIFSPHWIQTVTDLSTWTSSERAWEKWHVIGYRMLIWNISTTLLRVRVDRTRMASHFLSSLIYCNRNPQIFPPMRITRMCCKDVSSVWVVVQRVTHSSSCSTSHGRSYCRAHAWGQLFYLESSSCCASQWSRYFYSPLASSHGRLDLCCGMAWIFCSDSSWSCRASRWQRDVCSDYVCCLRLFFFFSHTHSNITKHINTKRRYNKGFTDSETSDYVARFEPITSGLLGTDGRSSGDEDELVPLSDVISFFRTKNLMVVLFYRMDDL